MIYKCKICGGSLKFNKGETVCTCEYCGTKQTLPRLDSEKKKSLLDRADNFRRNNDYDKASVIYEQILADEKTDSEVYWLNLLCRYGIEYVEDPKTKRRIPTINRVQYDSILKDKDYLKALELANPEQKEIYEQEATYINKVQSQILDISNKEEPFDIFICYKETDNNGRRTEDSVLAQDIYKELTNEGYKVFFSRITLEDKLGTSYEPYIFSALNSAKVMLVIGTKKEHFESVWVKNEWSRYLSLVKSGQKKLLVPCYKYMNPYDLPEDFKYLQSQDINKIGYVQDIQRGIGKVLSNNNYHNVNKKNKKSLFSIVFIILLISIISILCFFGYKTKQKNLISNLIINYDYDTAMNECISYDDFLVNFLSKTEMPISLNDLSDYDDALFEKYLLYVSNTFLNVKKDFIENNSNYSTRRYFYPALLRHYVSNYSHNLFNNLSKDKSNRLKNCIITSIGIYSKEDAISLFNPPVDYESTYTYMQEIILTLKSYNNYENVDTSIMDKYVFNDEGHLLYVYNENYIRDYLSLFNTEIGCFDTDIINYVIENYNTFFLSYLASEALAHYKYRINICGDNPDFAFEKIKKYASMFENDYDYNYIIDYVDYNYEHYHPRFTSNN